MRENTPTIEKIEREFDKLPTFSFGNEKVFVEKKEARAFYRQRINELLDSLDLGAPADSGYYEGLDEDAQFAYGDGWFRAREELNAKITAVRGER